MLGLTVKQIVQFVDGKLNSAVFETVVIDDVSTDSRRVSKRTLFVPLKGEKADGHDYLQQVVAGGGCVLCARRDIKIENGACIYVEDTLQALQKLANSVRLLYNIPVIAITGSNGKTTTKEIVFAALSEKFNVLKNEGNFNNEIGLPLTLLRLTAEHQCAIVEMGMRGLGQIDELCQIARPTIGIVTNVGETHIELLRSVENIALAKSELPQFLQAGQLLVLNADDINVGAMAKATKANVVTYGFCEMADVRATNIVATVEGITFAVSIDSLVFSVFLPAVGIHNVHNALAAIAVAWNMGLSAEEIVAGLKKYKPAGMRMLLKKINGVNVIEDCYNASPLSMNAALDTLALFTGRKIAVLADMLELGDHSERLHREIGFKIAKCGVSALVTYGKRAEYIAIAAKEQGMTRVMAFQSHDDVRSFLRGFLRADDVLLVKGSRGMELEKVLSAVEEI
ncbi:MAG: UDP-N-acetylmuramoyl-tripeptide--D-alanyl-D-alanine ligase [Negativicutes bacterium]|jgi:UDP-N-acetylmuramoyl-tripeptide--D-alanyl-D-alanine ligase